MTVAPTTSTLEYIHLAPGGDPPALSHIPTRALIVADELVDPYWQQAVSLWLLETGCLYMLAWGTGCSSWDDSVDMANHEMFDFEDIPDEFDAMTTWHEGESLSEFMWFAKHCAMHSSIELERTLLLHIGHVARKTELLAAYAEA